MKKVAIIMGSVSDRETMYEAEYILQDFGIDYEVMVMSAHRTPDIVHEFCKNAFRNDFGVIIAAAGMSAHLAGVAAATTLVPVFGVPMGGGHLNGLDALLSTVNMPGGVSVPTFGIGKSGAKNAALAAVQMFAVVGGNNELLEKLEQYRLGQTKAILETNVSKVFSAKNKT